MTDSNLISLGTANRLIIFICKYFGNLLVFILTCWLSFITYVLLINMMNGIKSAQKWKEYKESWVKFEDLSAKVNEIERKLSKIIEYVNKK
jgi:hypothetical protein